MNNNAKGTNDAFLKNKDFNQKNPFPHLEKN